jgi:hypothetical protein
MTKRTMWALAGCAAAVVVTWTLTTIVIAALPASDGIGLPHTTVLDSLELAAFDAMPTCVLVGAPATVVASLLRLRAGIRRAIFGGLLTAAVAFESILLAVGFSAGQVTIAGTAATLAVLAVEFSLAFALSPRVKPAPAGPAE